MLTGYQCAGCGCQRAIHSLLHLQLDKALEYNAFLVFSIPYLLLLFLLWLLPNDQMIKARAIAHHRITVYVYLTLLVTWWIGRNLVCVFSTE